MCRPKGGTARPIQTANNSTLTDYFKQLRKTSTTIALKYFRDPKVASADLVQLLTDPGQLYVTCSFLILVELILSIGIVQHVPYTEIDWKAYMQEVEGVLNGTFDYAQLRGDTGPLVYPAGFVYIYMALYYITGAGAQISVAQYVFVVFYIAQLVLSYRLLRLTAKVPPYAVLLAAAASYRIHSIYMLRLFNDPIAVLLLYGSLNALVSNRWWTCSILYTLAVSVKMNILLYAPALLLAYLACLPSLWHTIAHLTLCACVQLVLALPFILPPRGNLWSYLQGAFDLGRIFEHRWTVNWRFLPIEWFEWRGFHLALLALHVVILGAFLPGMLRYMKSYGTLRRTISEIKVSGIKNKPAKGNQKTLARKEEKLSKVEHELLDGFERMLKQKQPKKRMKQTQDDSTKDVDTVHLGKVTQLVVLPFYVCNLVGVACARSLHYQFYSWYYHSLLYLVYCTSYSRPAAFLLLGTIEYCWNVYPSTNISSALLHVCHVLLIYQLYKYMRLNK